MTDVRFSRARRSPSARTIGLPGRASGALGAVLAAGALAAGCTGGAPVLPDQSGPPTPSVAVDAWTRLAGRAAAAQDKRYVAGYTLSTKGMPARTLTVTVAGDGSWLVVVPRGALGGTADGAVAGTPSGLYQCALGATPGCVRVGGPGSALPARYDPRIEHLFTDWLGVFTDRQAAISVAGTPTLPGVAGDCYSIEPNSAALAAPVDPGIYCYNPDGTLTGAALAMGTLVLSGVPAPAPATVTLPAPVVPGSPLPMSSPPPSPSPTARS